MVVTRSSGVPKKIKFSDEDVTKDVEYHTADENEQKASEDESEDEESESDDEAPEEESTSSAKISMLKQQKEKARLEQEQKKAEKERRRKQDNLHAEQQRIKKQNEASTPAALPEYLPEDIFDAIENDSEEEELSVAQQQAKHLKLEDFEELDKKELAKQLKEEKLRRLKLQKKLIVKKGPVHVKVASSAIRQVNKKLVPKAESKIVNSRNKWLKRKSLGKK
ncbi:bud site selection protein 21 [[Candida] anglica]|uniref:Bud site selection protein 21 n=1 Tax=[Candida] anglica TaxID=148631 RepID=A0ABP0EGZ4_9ASCO